MLSQNKGTNLSTPKLFGTFLSFMPLSSESLKKLRENLGLTQEEFANKVGVSRELLGQMERGQKGISKATTILIDNFFRTQITKDKEEPLNEQEDGQKEQNTLLDAVVYPDIVEGVVNNIKPFSLDSFPNAIELFETCYPKKNMHEVFPYLASEIYWNYPIRTGHKKQDKVVLAIRLLLQWEKLTKYMKSTRKGVNTMEAIAADDNLKQLRDRIKLIAYELKAITRMQISNTGDLRISNLKDFAASDDGPGFIYDDDDLDDVKQGYQATIDDLNENIEFYVEQIYNLTKKNSELEQEIKSLKEKVKEIS